MKAVVRNASDGDESAIARYAIKLFEQHVEYDPGRFSLLGTIEGAEAYYRSRFETSESRVLVATLTDAVVGFAYVEKDDLNYAELLERGAWLHDIYVDESARGMGVGELLLDAAVGAARQLGAEKLLLTVASKNTLAQRAFEKAGFRQTMSEMTLNLKGA